MSYIFLLFFVAIVMGVLLLLKLKKNSNSLGEENWPYYAKKPLTAPEQVLYFRLIEALPHHVVLAQVQLSRILGVKKGNNYQSWTNRINRMSVDFVVCAKDSSILAVIELDDSTHLKPDRLDADSKKNKAFGAAQIKIIRWQVKSIPNVAEIKHTLMPSQLASEEIK